MLVLVGLTLFVGLQLVVLLVCQHRSPEWQARQLDPSIAAGRKALDSSHV